MEVAECQNKVFDIQQRLEDCQAKCSRVIMEGDKFSEATALMPSADSVESPSPPSPGLVKVDVSDAPVSKGNHQFKSDTLPTTAATTHKKKKNPQKTWLAEEIQAFVKERNRHLSFLQVGACDGDFNTSTSNDPLQKALSNSLISAALIEPNPPVFETLQHNVKAFFGLTPRIRAFNMAVCPSESGKVPFYVISPKFAIDYPDAPHWAKFQLSSMSYKQVLKSHEVLKLPPEEWSRYIQELMVPCNTPTDLLNVVGFGAQQVDVLQVDAEGYDGQIIHSFLDLRGFDPHIIIFEMVHLAAGELNVLRRVLRHRGYRVFDNIRGNTLAIKKSRVIQPLSSSSPSPPPPSPSFALLSGRFQISSWIIFFCTKLFTNFI
eukprot:gnl/MRDRNA2_/MRDRNA2_470625_c0_seq1.p1 gnl/MRDRNA2_/MRDRNA2_470625_c0~~gnl/MRDRNA2_/MRDRNA2_470625_c0_seq1.p1  ORF type:complete len:376 (-),score=69.20 gnl/MRDRNA2_/MRDRNA2_470625_c0_seq1:33-1160(-)